jgi:hypothetical protein
MQRAQKRKNDQSGRNKIMLEEKRRQIRDLRDGLITEIRDTAIQKSMMLEQEAQEEAEQRLADEANGVVTARPVTVAGKGKRRRKSPGKRKKKVSTASSKVSVTASTVSFAPSTTSIGEVTASDLVDQVPSTSSLKKKKRAARPRTSLSRKKKQ